MIPQLREYRTVQAPMKLCSSCKWKSDDGMFLLTEGAA
jgi:hypothetical protein